MKKIFIKNGRINPVLEIFFENTIFTREELICFSFLVEKKLIKAYSEQKGWFSIYIRKDDIFYLHSKLIDMSNGRRRNV